MMPVILSGFLLTASACEKRAVGSACSPECAGAATCVDGVCRTACDGDDDCGATQECLFGYCEDTLTCTDEQCDEGCPAELCTPPCQGSECPTPCTETADCPLGFECSVDGICVGTESCFSDGECIYDDPCVIAQGLCVSGFCQYTYREEDSSCDTGVTCMGLGRCNADHVCEGAEILVGASCDGGICVDDAGAPVCSSDTCVVDGESYAAGTPMPSNPCMGCVPSVDATAFSDWIGEDCPLGCALDPIPHCIQPSGWGYWEGNTPRRDGLSIDWIQESSGSPSALVKTSGTLSIDTGNNGEGTVIVNGATVTAANIRIISQADFQATDAVPGVPSAEIPELIAIRFSNIDISGSAQVVCTGGRPLALVSQTDARLGGTWDIRCGQQAGGNADDGAYGGAGGGYYGSSGGGGGGFGGNGGASGNGLSSGGTSFGYSALQPLVGGSMGGQGMAQHSMDISGINAATLGAPECWWTGADTGGCDLMDIATWSTNVFSNYPAPNPLGGNGGGALQVVALGGLTVEGQLRAWGEGGGTGSECLAVTYSDDGDPSNDFNGDQLNDYKAWPLRFGGCSACSDTTVDDEFWRQNYLQTGAGGGSGGAILLEAATVQVAPSARISTAGGAGGAACYMNGYTAGGSSYGNACARGTVTGQIYGPVHSSVPGTDYPNFWGPEGSRTGDGSDAPYGSANPTDQSCGTPEVTIPTDESVAWGGGGGAAGRIRINSGSGSISCSGDCSASFEPPLPSSGETCRGAAQLCTFGQGLDGTMGAAATRN